VQEGDISEDGDYLPLCGDGTAAFSTGCRPIQRDRAYRLQGLNAVYVTPENNLLLTGTFGIRMVKNTSSWKSFPGSATWMSAETLTAPKSSSGWTTPRTR